MKKSVLLIVSMWLLSGQIFAQRFEWAKGFASGENVTVVGSVVDSVGNLYILGSINFNTSWENGSRLLPIAPYGYAQDIGDVMIAKVSLEGDLVWHKIIHGEEGNSLPHDIKLIGDTAFACLVSMPLASESGYLYYLDTLVRKGGYGIYPDYPLSTIYSSEGRTTAFISFDFDGNVKEQHFLWMSYLDYNGEDIVRTYTQYPQPWYQSRTYDNPSFAFDSEGNIYLSRRPCDIISAGPGNDYSVENGTISAVKFWCDRRVVGVAPADSNKHFSPQILKFSPRFDTLLSSKYVYQTRNNNISCWGTKINYHAPHIYASFWLVPNNTQQFIVFDSTNGIQTIFDANRHAEKSVIIKYDSSLTAVNVIAIEDTITNPATFQGLMFVLLNDIVFDRDSNLAIVSVTAHKGIDGRPEQNMDNSYFIVNGNYVDFHQNAGIIIMDEETLELKSTGQLSTTDNSWNDSKLGAGGNLSCFNNRVFFQAKFKGSIQFPNHVIQTTSGSGHGLCLSVFDYNGNLIDGIDYRAQSTKNWPGPISMKDSILYLTTLLNTGATFGDIQVPSRGTYFACIAKYVDPAFMYPYGSAPTGISSVDTPSISVYPNPATDHVHVSLPTNELVIEAYVIDLAGRRRQVPAIMHNIDLTSAPAGILLLQIVTNNHIYTQRIIKL